MRAVPVLIGFALLACMGSRVSAGANLLDIIDRYRASLEPLKNSAIELSQLETATSAEGEVRVNSNRISAIRVGDRAFIEHRKWTAVSDASAPKESELRVVARYWLSNGRLLGLEHNVANSSERLFVSHNTPEFRLAGWQGPVLCGYFPANIGRIDEVLSKARTEVRAEPERVAGVPCVVVDATLPDASYTVWFAPEFDACIMRMIRVRHPHALRHRLADRQEYALRTPPSAPQRHPVRITQELDSVTVHRVSSRWIPVRGRLAEHTLYSDGSTATFTSDLRRLRVELDPQVSISVFTPEIRNGTKVSVVGKGSGLPQEWRDGEIVPSEDRESEERLNALVSGQRFIPPAPADARVGMLYGPVLFLGGVVAAFAMTCRRAAPRRAN